MRSKTFLVIALSLFAGLLSAQSSAPGQSTAVAVSELEQTKIESTMKDLAIIQLQFKQQQADAQAAYQAKQQALQTLVDNIKKAHKYGDDVTLNAQTGKLEKTPTKPTEKSTVPVIKK